MHKHGLPGLSDMLRVALLEGPHDEVHGECRFAFGPEERSVELDHESGVPEQYLVRPFPEIAEQAQSIILGANLPARVGALSGKCPVGNCFTDLKRAVP